MQRILIIEDEYDTAKVLKKRVEEAGYEAMVAYDSYSGSAAVKREAPDLVLLDLMLPAKGGETVLAEMKKTPETKDIPVIVITGITDDMVKETLYKMGVNDYIEKPYDAVDLLASIKKVLDKKRDKK